jgi:uncharacterized RDD family membrane protein YckC
LDRIETEALALRGYAAPGIAPGGSAVEEGRLILSVQAASTALGPAAMGARAVALIVDVIVVLILQWLLGTLLGEATIVGGLTRAVIFAALSFGYFGYSWTAWRASPGQRILGIVTVNAADGSALNWSQAAKRWAFLFGAGVLNSLFQFSGLSAIVWLFFVLYGVYLFYTAATDPLKQGFHDKQAGTLVATKTA